MSKSVEDNTGLQATQVDGLATGVWLQIVRVLLIAASLITAYLALISLMQGGQVPGCAPNSGCDKVLSSPWAFWLGIPVSLPGLGLYAAFLLSTFSLKLDQLENAKRALNTLVFCSFAILGVAIWFVSVQVIAIKAFCPYCCTAHGLASLAAIIYLHNANSIGSRLSVRLNLAGGIGAAACLVALIAGMQIVAPKQQTKPVVFQIPRSSLLLNAYRLPLIGSNDAPHQIGYLFDYTCHHCRQLHGYIRETVGKYNGKISCLMIPMPLDKSCNNFVERTASGHVDACEYAKICLAVHQIAPSKYDAFDRWLFTNHEKQKELEDVRQHAIKLIGTAGLGKALSGTVVKEQLEQNIRAYEINSKTVGSRVMPQIIINDHVMFGPSASATEFESELKKILKLDNLKSITNKMPERVVTLEQIEETPDELVYVKGEKTAFTGLVVAMYADGSKKHEMPVVNGLRRGIALSWHANGRKAEEVHWKDGLREGLARSWSKSGGNLGEWMYRPSQQERESVAKLRAEAGRIHREREQLDETVWKEETQAQIYEDTFVALWDALRSAKDKWKPFEDFTLSSIELPVKRETTVHDWNIHAAHHMGKKLKLDPEGWRAWLGALKSKGIEVVETEWHHEEFITKSDSTGSVFRFVVHALGPKSVRYIVRGKLRVTWANKKDATGYFQAGHIDVQEAVIFTRQGKTPFRELARLSPGEGNPSGFPGPNGSAPLAMPLLVYDLDRDGRSEMVLAGANIVYWNQGKGQFKKEILCRYYQRRLQAAVLADFDNDGFTDLLGMPEGSPPMIFSGDEHGRFGQPPKVIKLSGKVIDAGTCITAGDIDGDGDLDAWLTQNKPPYIGGQMPTPYYNANDGYPSFLLVNDGKGHFADKTDEAGLGGKRHRRTYSSSFVDLDSDEDLDLVVINDFSGLDVHLNNGKGRFTDVTKRLGDDRSSFGMSHALADFNGDSQLDLYMAGMGSTTARRLERMKLGRKEFPGHQKARMPMAYGNRMFLGGNDFLKQASYNDSVARTGWAWGCTALDFDNDGDRDIYITNGNISGKSAKDHCTTFWRHDVYTGTSSENPALHGLFMHSFSRLKKHFMERL